MNCYTREEVAKHNKLNDCWLIVNNKLYDVTLFINSHPGGRNAILKNAGTDQTHSYNFHRRRGKYLWKDYKIGYIKKDWCILL